MGKRIKNNKTLQSISRIFRFGSIQSVITLSFASISMIAMLLIGIVFYSSFSENARNNATGSTTQIMNQTRLNLEYYLDSMIEISNTIEHNMDSFTSGSIERLEDILSLTLDIREDIESITLYADTGSILMSVPDLKFDTNMVPYDQDWFIFAAANPFEYIFSTPHVQRIYQDIRPWVVTLSRGVVLDFPEGRRNYISTVDMNFSRIEEVCSQVALGHRGYIYVIDGNGKIIYHPQQQLIYAGLRDEDIQKALSSETGSYSEKINGEEISTVIMDVGTSGWKMVGVSYVDEIVRNRRNFNNLIVVILLVGLAFIVLASVFMSYKISQPILRLENQMNRIEKGDFNVDNLEVRGEDEVKQLTRSFNLMIERIRGLMSQIISEQEAKRKNELKALQAQINPHFLYNTLDSIIWMNENKNHEGVSAMTAALAKLFRISISKGNEIILVSEEIEHAISYLTIQKMRYKNKFVYTIDMPEELSGFSTLKLLLQPIIENAIYHGINNIPDEGKIDISVSREEDTLVYKVYDNGYGITSDKLKNIFMKESTSRHSSGVGLKNVNERIKLYYGQDYGIEIDSEPEVGTTVYIKIPVTEGNNE
ncbi:MAG: sensor histidine kinase [Clostridia bacterium]|nr:sensor histidine kinase [Clostridia bacterium]